MQLKVDEMQKGQILVEMRTPSSGFQLNVTEGPLRDLSVWVITEPSLHPTAVEVLVTEKN